MPPEPDNRRPDLSTRQALAELSPYYEVRQDGADSLYFTCARCRQVISSDEFFSDGECARYLAVHTASHLAGRSQTITNRGPKRPRRRGLDGSGRPDQSRFAFDYGDE